MGGTPEAVRVDSPYDGGGEFAGRDRQVCRQHAQRQNLRIRRGVGTSTASTSRRWPPAAASATTYRVSTWASSMSVVVTTTIGRRAGRRHAGAGTPKPPGPTRRGLSASRCQREQEAAGAGQALEHGVGVWHGDDGRAHPGGQAVQRHLQVGVAQGPGAPVRDGGGGRRAAGAEAGRAGRPAPAAPASRRATARPSALCGRASPPRRRRPPPRTCAARCSASRR